MTMLASTPVPAQEWYVDLRKSKLLLRAFADRYNAGRPLRERLRVNHLALMQELLELYRICLWRRQSGSQLLQPPTLPGLATNNVQLSQRLQCSERSVQNLRQRLRQAGLITREIWHGSRSSYEVFLQPEVVCVERVRGAGSGERSDRETWGQGDLERGRGSDLERGSGGDGERGALWKSAGMSPQKVHITGCTPTSYGENNSTTTENFSPYCTQSLLDTNQLNQLEVGKCGKAAGTGGDRPAELLREGGTGYETVGERSREQGAGGVARGRETGSGVTECVPQTFAAVVAGLPDTVGRAIWREVSQVWEVAREALYAGEWISKSERERAKARLAEYFIYAHPRRYAAGREEICERIRLVQRWIERGRQQGEERWVPIPSIYFDYRNRRGFRVTKGWYKQHLAKRKEIGDKIALARAVRRYRQCLEGGTEVVSPLEVYRELVAGLERRGAEVVASALPAVDRSAQPYGLMVGFAALASLFDGWLRCAQPHCLMVGFATLASLFDGWLYLR